MEVEGLQRFCKYCKGVLPVDNPAPYHVECNGLMLEYRFRYRFDFNPRRICPSCFQFKIEERSAAFICRDCWWACKQFCEVTYNREFGGEHLELMQEIQKAYNYIIHYYTEQCRLREDDMMLPVDTKVFICTHCKQRIELRP